MLLTGYDDSQQAFQVQDLFLGPNMHISYQALEERWKSFNYVYLLVISLIHALVTSLLEHQWEMLSRIANMHWSGANRKPREIRTMLCLVLRRGTNLVYFESYTQAAGAYDNARDVGIFRNVCSDISLDRSLHTSIRRGSMTFYRLPNMP